MFDYEQTSPPDLEELAKKAAETMKEQATASAMACRALTLEDVNKETRLVAESLLNTAKKLQCRIGGPETSISKTAQGQEQERVGEFFNVQRTLLILKDAARTMARVSEFFGF